MSRRTPRPKPTPPPAAPPSEASAPSSAARATSDKQPETSLADELRGLTMGLLWLSESEAPFSVLELPKNAILPDALRELLKLPPDAPAEEWTIEDLLTPAAAPDQPDAARYRALLVFLANKLTRPAAYKLGAEARKALFFIGRQPDKSWLGAQTEAVET